MKEQNDDEYMQDLNEWMEHQYDPGHYLGGDIPPAYKNPVNKKIGILLLVMGLGVGIIYTVIFINILCGTDEKMGIIGFSIFAYSIYIIQIIGGVRTLSKAYTKEEFKKLGKRIGITSITIIIIIGIGRLSVEQFKIIKTVEILDYDSFDIEQIQLKRYMYLKDEEIKLKCNEENYHILFKYKVAGDENIQYVITYKYYSFNQKKGTLLKIETKDK